MAKWTPISRDELQKIIEAHVPKMNSMQKSFWDSTEIKPEKWSEASLGKEGNGFWVIALTNKHVIWYNDIEDGFNISTFHKKGFIDQYAPEEDELQWAINKLMLLNS